MCTVYIWFWPTLQLPHRGPLSPTKIAKSQLQHTRTCNSFEELTQSKDALYPDW